MRNPLDITLTFLCALAIVMVLGLFAVIARHLNNKYPSQPPVLVPSGWTGERIQPLNKDGVPILPEIYRITSPSGKSVLVFSEYRAGSVILPEGIDK